MSIVRIKRSANRTDTPEKDESCRPGGIEKDQPLKGAMRTIVAEKGRIEFSGKIVVGGLGVSLVLVAGMVLAFATGMVETLGYESRDISGTGLTSTRMGHSFGLKTFYFIKGQEFFAEYETDIQKGSLTVHSMHKYWTLPTTARLLTTN
jgi:hypothetical protein